MVAYSILMSVYAKENPVFLKQAVRSMLAQNEAPQELVLVCDGPLTEALDEVISAFAEEYGEKFRVLRLAENRGLAAALNAGLEICQCEYVARMDSDDIALPHRVSTEFSLMEKTGATLVSSTVSEFNTPMIPENMAFSEIAKETFLNRLPRRMLPETDAEIRAFSRKRNPMNHPAVLMKKSEVLRAGGYREDYPYFEDYDLWLRMLKNGTKAANCPQTLVLMRTDEGMYARRGGAQYRKYMRAFRKRMLREGDCSRMDYIKTVNLHTLVALLPSGMRKKLYGKALRK